MRIENKYLRNRHFRNKHWKRVRATELPHRTFMPYNHESWDSSAEAQVIYHFEFIEKRARVIENGSNCSWNHAPKHFRQMLNRSRKAKVNAVMSKVRNGDYEVEFPTFKRDADWLYF